MGRAALLVAFLSTGAWAQWESLGPFGGSAAVVQTDAMHPGTVLIATTNAHLFRSRDAGSSWQPIPFPAESRAKLHAFVVDPNQPDVYLAGIAGELPDYTGLFLTRDAGQSWQSLPDFRGKDVWSIAMWKADSGVIAVGARDGVYLSRNGGAEWARISPADKSELQPVVSLAFDPMDSRVLYAGTPHLPWRTLDGGQTWQSADAGMHDDSDVFSIQVDHTQPRRLFASACSGIYRSRDSGLTWTKLTGAKGASYRTYFVAQNPRLPEHVYAGTTHGLVRSKDGGTTWERLSVEATRSIAFDATDPARLYVATDDAGVLRSDDGGATLRPVNRGFCNRFVPTVAAAGDFLYVNTIYESAGGVFRLNTGREWEKVAPASGLLGQQILAMTAAPGHPERIYAAGYSGLLASSNAGRTWLPVASPAKGIRVTALLAAGPDANRLLAGANAGLFRSKDGGKLWSAVELPGRQAGVRAIVRLTGSSVAAVSAGVAFLSEDSEHWLATAPLPDGADMLGIVAMDGGDLLAAGSTGLMRSADRGGSWTPVGGGLQSSTVSAIARHPVNETLFAVQYGTVYESHDHGDSWSKLANGDAAMGQIRSLVVRTRPHDELLALTQNHGVFALPLEAAAAGVPGATQ
jgi:photosystem II stability/assembly factor-like uncharacterized protein